MNSLSRGSIGAYAGLGGAIALASAILAMSVGTASISVAEVVGALMGRDSVDPIHRQIIVDLRLPRVVLAFFVGGGLSIVGVAMQTLVRNPLAEPYILGISGGAAAGASLFYLGFLPPIVSRALSLPISAFAGGMLAITVVYLIARSGTYLSVTRLLLAGVAMSALMGAITAFVTFASPEPDRLRTVLFWLMGSFAGSGWADAAAPATLSTGAMVVLFLLHRPLDSMLLGDDRAWNLGIPVEQLKVGLLVMAALVTGPLVAAVGAIGFVGLIVPHIVRLLVGVRHRSLVALSFLGGGIFMMWMDTLARTAITGQELPVGVLTALCGVPFFLWLLRSRSYHFGS
jgi:iron complex transport system permease protein